MNAALPSPTSPPPGFAARPPLHVLHALETWLPAREAWLDLLLRRMPGQVTSHVACVTTDNPALFPHPRLYSLAAGPRARFALELGLRRLGLTRGLSQVARVAHHVRPHLLHSHFAAQGWSDLETAQRLGLPHVVSIRGGEADGLPTRAPIWQARYRELFAFTALILCDGPYVARRLAARGCAPERIRVHHRGVDLERFRYRPRRRGRGEPLRVLLAAPFRARSGLPDALTALARLRRSIDLEISIAGDANQTTPAQMEKARILDAVRDGDLGARVRFLGFRSREGLHEEAGRHHVFMYTPRQVPGGDCDAGTPLTMIEMAASGMPVVATLHCDIPEVVRHGQTGLLAPEGRIDTLADHIAWLARRPDDWRPMLDAARAHVEREFDVRRQGERLADIYAGLLGVSRADLPPMAHAA